MDSPLNLAPRPGSSVTVRSERSELPQIGDVELRAAHSVLAGQLAELQTPLEADSSDEENDGAPGESKESKSGQPPVRGEVVVGELIHLAQPVRGGQPRPLKEATHHQGGGHAPGAGHAAGAQAPVHAVDGAEAAEANGDNLHRVMVRLCNICGGIAVFSAAVAAGAVSSVLAAPSAPIAVQMGITAGFSVGYGGWCCCLHACFCQSQSNNH